MELQGNKLKIIYKSAKNTQKCTISVIHILYLKKYSEMNQEALQSTSRTPNIDTMASEGAKLVQYCGAES